MRFRFGGPGILVKPNDLENLYRANFQKVYNYAFYRLLDPAEAEDVTSTVFVKAIASFDRFDSDKASFSTWVMRIAHNVLIDYYRTRKVNAPLDQVGVNEPVCVDDYPALDDRQARVAELLALLSEEDRELVFLKYYEGKKNIEIANMLDMNPSTVATRLRRALLIMREHAEKENMTVLDAGSEL